MSESNGPLEGLIGLYQRNRFQDAWRLVQPHMAGSDDAAAPDRLDVWRRRAATASAEDLVWASRLVIKLGGAKLGRWIYFRAEERFPEHPMVVAYRRWHRRGDWNIYRAIQEAQQRPELSCGDGHLDTMWLADSAHFYAFARDFEQARRLLARARQIGGDDAWCDCSETWSLYLQDRWAEAADMARTAWRRSPGLPAAAGLLATLLPRVHCLDEAIELLSGPQADQSIDCLASLIWLVASKAERSDPAGRRELALHGWSLAERLEDLAPLRDRHVEDRIAAIRFDLSMLVGDHQRARQAASRLRHPIYRQISQSLEKARGDGAPALVGYEPIFQKRNMCLPTSICCIASAVGKAIDPDELAAAISYTGTAAWRAVRHLRQTGWSAKVFYLTADLCRRLLGSGLPFVYLIEYAVDASHATAAVGLDESAGLMIYHDPAGERFGRVLLDRLDENEAPLGPLGIAFVPQDRAAELDVVPREACELAELVFQYREALITRGIQPAREVLERLRQLAPDSPVTESLTAEWEGLVGQAPESIARLERLLERFPRSIWLHRSLLSALQRTRNTARIRQVSGELVRRGRTPGISEGELWRYPPSAVTTQYADMLAQTAEGARPAERLLMKLLTRDAGNAMAMHVLGDLYQRSNRTEEAVLAYRLASLMDESEEHFAWMACESLRLTGRGEQGLDYLRERVERLGRLVDGGGPWMTLIQSLEEAGQPEQACEQARLAAQARPDDSAMHLYLMQFWIRMGQWSSAKAALETVQRLDHPERHYEAACHFAHMAGRWQDALGWAEKWVAESPSNIEAHRQLARLESCRQTVFEMARRTQTWMDLRPGDEAFQFLHYEQLQACFLPKRCRAFLDRRLADNPLDAWAWRELAHWLVDRLATRPDSGQDALRRELGEAVAQADRLAPQDPATLFVHGRVAELDGRWSEAIEAMMQGLEVAPDFGPAYGAAWDNAANLPADRQRELLGRLERVMLRIPGQLHVARELALRAASRIGAVEAERCVSRWAQARLDDPEVLEAHADLLLEYGQGQTDVRRAERLLADAVQRFPQHLDLRTSLALAYGRLDRHDQAIALLEKSLEEYPLAGGVRRVLAAALERHGHVEQALRVLREGVCVQPRDAAAWMALARTLWGANQFDQAVEQLAQASRLMPEIMDFRELLVNRLADIGQAARAVQVAQEGVDLYPEGSATWLLLAMALQSGPLTPDAGRVESALRNALRFNQDNFDAADALAVFLARQGRYDQARQLLEQIAPRLPNASPALGRMAWVRWTRGDRRGAVDDLLGTLASYPAYPFGWRLLMDWLEELNDGELIGRALEPDAHIFRSDAALASRRLQLLPRASVARDRIELLWRQMLDDFPREEDVYLRRFDLLAEAGQWNQAAELLDTSERLCGPSPWQQARRVAVLLARRPAPDAADRGRQARHDAIDLAIQVARTSLDAWPASVVWDHLSDAGLLPEAVARMIDALSAGQSAQRDGLMRMMALVAKMPPKVRVAVGGQPLNRAQVVRRLVELLEKSSWDEDSVCLGAALEHLADLDARFVDSFRKANAQRCSAQTRIWQAIGYHLVVTGRYADARSWVADWRDRPGVEMTGVSYFRLGCGAEPAGRLLEQIVANASDCLERLPTDKTVRFHAASLCEALLRLGRLDEFRQAVARYGQWLADEDPSMWLPDYYGKTRLPEKLLQVDAMLAAQDGREALKWFRRIRRRCPRFLARLAHRELRRRVGWLRAFLTWTP